MPITALGEACCTPGTLCPLPSGPLAADVPTPTWLMSTQPTASANSVSASAVCGSPEAPSAASSRRPTDTTAPCTLDST